LVKREAEDITLRGVKRRTNSKSWGPGKNDYQGRNLQEQEVWGGGQVEKAVQDIALERIGKKDLLENDEKTHDEGSTSQQKNVY